MTVGLITNFAPYIGLGKYAFELFSRLSKKIDAKLVYCNGEKNDNFGDFQISGINFPVFRKTLNASFIYPKKIPDFDLYHATNQFLSNVAKFKKPSIVTVTDLYFIKSSRNAPLLSRIIMKRTLGSLKFAERIISISNYTKNDLINLFNIDSEKIRIVNLGIDTNRFTPHDKKSAREKLNLPSNKKIIFSICSDSDMRKNVETIIKTFNEAQKEDKNLFLVRLGKKDERITSMIKKLGLEGKILRIERVKEETLPLLYSAADAYLNLDLETGFGLPPIESMACSTPVLCSNVGEFSELIGDVGMSANPLNVEEIKNNLLILLNDGSLRRQLISRGLKLALRYTWDSSAEETLKVYREVVDV